MAGTGDPPVRANFSQDSPKSCTWYLYICGRRGAEDLRLRLVPSKSHVRPIEFRAESLHVLTCINPYASGPDDKKGSPKE